MTMELRTYTSLWQVERRIYRLYDINLPYAVSVKQILVFLGFTIPWLLLLNLVKVPFAAPWHAVYIIPPIAVTFFASKTVAESKTLAQLLYSQGRFFTQARKYARLYPYQQPDVIDVATTVWLPPGSRWAVAQPITHEVSPTRPGAAVT